MGGARSRHRGYTSKQRFRSEHLTGTILFGKIRLSKGDNIEVDLKKLDW
jgi:hypothetical protein